MEKRKLFGVTENEGKYNFRLKLYPTSDGGWYPAEEMCCETHIFNPDGLEAREPVDRSGSAPTSPAEKLERSRARAKAKVFDLIMCNEFQWFVTLTLSPDMVGDRTDYKDIVHKLNVWLANRVQRNGLYYIGVCEKHKRGGLHFHFLTNDTICTVESGTYIRPSGGRPVKPATVFRSGFRLEDCRTVYNVPDWRLGFTTSIRTYGARGAVANYIGKYITKGEKVGGRWYFSGGELTRPRYVYSNVDVDDFEQDFSLDTPRGKIHVRRFAAPSELTVSGMLNQ